MTVLRGEKKLNELHYHKCCYRSGDDFGDGSFFSSEGTVDELIPELTADEMIELLENGSVEVNGCCDTYHVLRPDTVTP